MPIAADRAPIVQTVLVRSGVRHTFDVFIRDIGLWWPTATHSLGRERIDRVVVEPTQGGRVYEVCKDGTENTWGTLVAWEPPHGFVLTWDILPGGTEVELRFKALGPALTRVELEHRGWDRLDPAQLAAAVGDTQRSYDAGWSMILARFVTTVETGEPPADGQSL